MNSVDFKFCNVYLTLTCAIFAPASIFYRVIFLAVETFQYFDPLDFRVPLQSMGTETVTSIHRNINK